MAVLRTSTTTTAEVPATTREMDVVATTSKLRE